VDAVLGSVLNETMAVRPVSSKSLLRAGFRTIDPVRSPAAPVG
jgi:hypothetical protein